MRKQSLKTLRKKADKALSDYIRQRDKGICCTCHQIFPIEKLDAGHWIPRTQWGTRYDEQNVHSQCQGCNRFQKPQDEYAEFMLQKYGRKVMNRLRKQKHITLVEFVNSILCNIRETQGKYKGQLLRMAETSRDAYEVIIRHYTHKLEKLQ